MKKHLKTTAVMLGLFLGLCSFAGFIYSSQPPQGYAGADGSYCIDCHNSYPINNGGGSIEITGLPDAGYAPGTTYNFSLTTTHSAADRKRWGFSIEARNALNQTVGTFGSANANAAINGNELSHNRAVITPFQSSFTYNNLTWTAPANPTADDQTITFYYVGNAANGTGSTAGDFIYFGSKAISLQPPTYTFTGNGNWDNPANWSNGKMPPAILSGNSTIIVDPPLGSECVLNVTQHVQTGANFIVNTGKSFRVVGELNIK